MDINTLLGVRMEIATGQVPFRFNISEGVPQWYLDSEKDSFLTVTLSKTRPSPEPAAPNPSSQEVIQFHNAWLSVSRNTVGYACVYMLQGVNASAASDRLNGCDGVLSIACTSELKKVTLDMRSARYGACPLFQLISMMESLCGGRFTGGNPLADYYVVPYKFPNQ
jgi:hypothetical protein